MATKKTIAKGKKPAAKKAVKKAPVKKAVAKSAIKKVVKKVTEKKRASKPVAKKAVKKVAAKPLAKKASAKKVVKKVTPKPIAKKVVVKAKPLAKKTAPKKPTAKPIVAKKVEVKKAPAKKASVVKTQPKAAPVKVVAKPIPVKAVKPIAVKPAPTPKPLPVKQTPDYKQIIVKNTLKTTMSNVKPSSAPEGPKLSDAELQEFKTLIVNKLNEARIELVNLQAQIVNANENGTDDTGASFKMLEDGSDTLAKEEAAQLAARQKKFIEQLEAALVRIENKTYGICRVTGKLIPRERLRAVPHTTQSMEAKMQQYRD